VRVFLGILMILIGTLGFALTLCGIFFLPAGGIGLIAIIPGALLMFIAYAVGASLNRSESESQTPVDTTDSNER